MKNPKINKDEINLIDLMKIVWEGKRKIAAAVVISFIAVISYQLTQTKNFTAITNIKPVNSSILEKYSILNNIINLTDTNFNFQKITEKNLLNLYVDVLNDKSVFEDAMRKLNLLDASQYSDKQKYNEEITKLASSVKILSPIIDKKEEGNSEIFYHSVNFIHDDVKKWKDILIYVDVIANELVKKKISKDFYSTLLFLKQNKKYQSEKLKILMINNQIDFDKEMKKFEMNLEFQLEDAQTKIDNALVDYDRQTADRLAFLHEQASIARKLEIAKNTIEVQTFSTKNSMVANIKTDTPFYLRGYEAIEKEIELIQSRDDKQAFVDGLFKLEQQKRSLEQNKTLLRVERNKIFLDTFIELEKSLRAIKQDKTIERVESAYQSTPLINNTNFFAASLNIFSTEFKYKDNKHMLKTAIVIGLIIGIFYVLISNAFQSHRVYRKKLIKPTF